jgi:hypothetical protein
MPLTLQSINFSIICNENELELYDVKQESSNSTTAFVASEAGKVSVPKIPFVSTRKTNCRDQQFKILIANNLLDFDLAVFLYIDGASISGIYFRVGQSGEFRGVQNSATTELPFKFQELELVGTFYEHSLDIMFIPYFLAYFIICY